MRSYWRAGMTGGGENYTSRAVSAIGGGVKQEAFPMPFPGLTLRDGGERERLGPMVADNLRHGPLARLAEYVLIKTPPDNTHSESVP